jgi:hypothetical protein
MTYKGQQIDVRSIPGNSATKVALKAVNMFFGSQYLNGRLVEPSGKSNKMAMSPEKVALLKSELSKVCTTQRG